MLPSHPTSLPATLAGGIYEIHVKSDMECFISEMKFQFSLLFISVSEKLSRDSADEEVTIYIGLFIRTFI